MKMLLIGTARLLLGLVTFVLIWPALVLPTVIMVWWHLVGIVGWFGGRRVRMFLGRWLGAYLFSWSVVLLLAIMALFHANATGVWSRAWFRQAAENCVVQLQTMQDLKKIGGLW